MKNFTPRGRSDRGDRDRGEGRSFSKGFSKNFRKDFKKDFGRPGFGGKPRFGGGGFRDRGDTPQFEAICANCKKTCMVPFRPNGVRPVYCKECFPQFAAQLEGASDRPKHGRFDRSDRPQRDFAPRHASTGGADTRALEAISAKLDRLIDLLERGSKAASVEAPVASSPAEAPSETPKAAPKKATKKPKKKSK